MMSSKSGNVFISWIVSLLDRWAQYSSFRNFIKTVLRQLTGKCELQRICEMGKTDPETIKIMENALYLSKFPEIRRIVVAEEIKVKSAFEVILRTKHILPDENPGFMQTMPVFLSKIISYNKLISKVDRIRATSYDEDNDEHEVLLQKLWNLLQPDEQLEGRYTKQWGNIGFQGNNPATDFRGMGVLSLRNLIFFIETEPEEAKRIFILSLHPRFGYPFAVAGINLTGVAFELLRLRKLKSYFYSTDAVSYQLEDFQKVFVKIFCGFGKFYISSEPENIMEFNNILGKYKETMMTRLENNDIKNDVFTISD